MAKRNALFMMAIKPDKIGGLEVFATELARQLNAIGWDLTMAFEAAPPPMVRDFLMAPGNVTVKVQANQTALGARETLRFLKLLLQKRPDVLVYTLGGVVRLWPRLAKLTGTKRVVYYDQTSRIEKAMGYRASAKVRKLMKAVDLQVCATKFVQQCANNEGVLPVAKTCVIYNSIDTNRATGDGAMFRKRFEIPPERIVILQVSWLVPEKGIDVALRAGALALQQRDDLHFVFAGDGAHRAEYERLAEDLGIADRVTWTGQVADLFGTGVFAAADIQMQCSVWREAFSLAVAEGMSAGLPLIASRIGGLPEVVSDGETGLLVEPGAPEELSEAILRLASDPALRRQMGEAGRRKAVALFDLRQVVAQWMEVLTAPLNDRRRV